MRLLGRTGRLAARGALVLVASLVVVGATAAHAQDAAAPLPERLPPGEVTRLFDAYAVVQAQDALGLDNAQYGTFVSGYRALLETRRRNREVRTRLVTELARLVRSGASPDEGQVRDRLRALQDHDVRAAAEVTQALGVVEQPLTIVQRARFLVFEEQMERRKLELLSRARMARQGNRRGMQP